MERAHVLGMTNGDYVFIYWTLMSGWGTFEPTPWLAFQPNEGANLTAEEVEERRRIFYPLKAVCHMRFFMKNMKKYVFIARWTKILGVKCPIFIR